MSRTMNRSRLWSVLAPQPSRVDVLRLSLAKERQRGMMVPDDTPACELIGQPVQLVSGAKPNPKVTVRADLPLVESVLAGANRPGV